MTAEQQWLPMEEMPAWSRLLWRVFGEARMQRWVIRMEERHPWLVEPESEKRCPYRTPADDKRCVNRAGHKGVCATERFVTNVQTGETTRELDYWRGINYRIDGDTSDLTWVHGDYPVAVDQVVEVTAGQDRALRRFQREAGITVDGVLGPQTWNALSAKNEEDR